MALKTGIFSLVLGTLLLGSNAMADGIQLQISHTDGSTQIVAQGGIHGGRGGRDRWNDNDRRYGRPLPHAHVHGSDCRHGPQPTSPRYEEGRYELRLTQQWVPGRYEQVWVPQDCRYRPRRGTTQCRGGYYEQRWVEGRYETAEQWVWVPGNWHRNSGPEWTAPVNYSY